MAFHALAVSRVDPVAEDAVALTLDVPAPLRDAFRFIPGQHLTVRHRAAGGGPELRRSYSICSPATPAADGSRLTIGVRHLPGGAFSAHAAAKLGVGDTVEVLPPAGRFTLHPRPGHFAAISGGSGITPILSMAATLLAAEPAARFALLRSERTAASAMFLDEVADLKDRYPGRFQPLLALTREERQAGLAAGRLDAGRLRALLPALLPVGEIGGWYLCGPPGLIAAAREALRDLAVPPERVHAELFHAETAPPPPTPQRASTGATLTATLDGRRATWPVRDGETLLAAVLRHRPDAPYACRGGVCGTCRARLVRGEARMERNYALDPPDLAAGYVLTCQTHPVSDAVEVDYDA